FHLDTTRIFSLISWGVLLVCIFHSYKLARSMQDEEPDYYNHFLQALILIGIISLITPRYFSWAGEIHSTPFFEWMGKLFN
ncbi:MAG TPA: hypothetical protein VJ972_07290, partial [Anaerolineales bacterium]|nr:hypothetical protein [Anaerolineales bacterium]